MSGTTIEARVRPGTAIAAELAALRAELDASLKIRVQEALGGRTVHVRGTTADGTRSVVGSRTARRGTTHTRSTNGRRASDLRAVSANSSDALRRELAAHDEKVIQDRTRELVFERMIQRLPSDTVVRNTTVAASGNRVAHIDVAGGGEVKLVVDEQGRADLLMDRCELAQLDSPDGVVAGCDAEAELGRRFHMAWRDSGLEVEADELAEGDGGQQAMAAGS